MRWWLFYILMVFLLAPMCLRADEILIPENMGRGYSFTAGVMFAINADLSNEGQTRPLLGIAWFGSAGDAFGANSAFGLSAEWLNYERSNGDLVNLMPILLNFKAYGLAAGCRISTTLGIGVLAVDDDIPEMRLNQGGNFGWTAKLGIDFTNEFFVQGSFIGSSNPSEDGFAGIQLGYRL